MLYASIRTAGWNLALPSRTEPILWCISTAFLIGTSVVFWMVESVAKGYQSGFIHRFSKFVGMLRPSRGHASMTSPQLPPSLEEGTGLRLKTC